MYKVCIDPEEWKRKPSGNKLYRDKPYPEAAAISMRIAKHTVDLEKPSELWFFISLGQAWIGSTFRDGKRKQENFEQQQVYGVDIDDGKTLDYIHGISKDYGLHPNIIHQSFTSKPSLQKWRVIFFADESTTDGKLAKRIIKTLTTIYGGDPAAAENARILYGTRNLDLHQINDDTVVSNSTIIEIADALDIEIPQEKKQRTLTPEQRERTRAKTENYAVEQRRILTKLQHNSRTKNLYDIIISMMQQTHDEIVNPPDSRYMALWKGAMRLGKVTYLLDDFILVLIYTAVEETPDVWENYDKNIPSIVENGLEYGRNHVIF